MDPAWLADQLAAGRSIESLARETGRSPSTVAYWVNKHGLTSAHALRHAPRGGIEREALAELVEEGLSIREIADRLVLSYTSVRHWLRRYELVTPRARRLASTREARAAGAAEALVSCPVHGATRHVRRPDGGLRCLACRSDAVARRRREVKAILVREAGGACLLCGYAASTAALHFHHLDPADKAFGLGRAGLTRSLATARAEAAKCVLLCATCHAEVERGVKRLPC
jgi:lambda repressor-like predicted transcriptional regulator